MYRKNAAQPARNDVLWQAIHDVWPSVAAFCRAEGFIPTVVGALINCTKSPVGARGDYLDVAKRLSEALGIGCDELFPIASYVCGRSLAVSEVPFSTLDGQDLAATCAAMQSTRTPEDDVFAYDLAEQTRHVLGALSPRAVRVIERRFGFGRSDQSLIEVAADLHTTPERVRQIEALALRILRHPSHSKHLKAYACWW